MSDLDSAVGELQSAIGELVSAARSCSAVWDRPRAPGKWSAAQTVEHVALTLDESARVVAGDPSKFPTLPRLIRPFVRTLFFNRALNKGTFPKSRTPRVFQPISAPADPDEARSRVEAAAERFIDASRARAATGRRVESTVFGTIAVGDYLRFQSIHARHHRKQLEEVVSRTAV